jgi:hypothetical protein
VGSNPTARTISHKKEIMNPFMAYTAGIIVGISIGLIAGVVLLKKWGSDD